MKILCVIDSLGSGGAQRQFVNIANGLSSSHDVEVFLYNPGSDFYSADLLTSIPVHRVKRPEGVKGFQSGVVRDLVRFARQSQAVVSFLPTANIYCAIAARFARRTKHVACEMSVVNDAESGIRRRLANLANKSSDHVICNSFTQSAYIEKQPGMAGKVTTVWNGCADLTRTPRDFAEKLELGFLVMARVAYPKNGVRLLQALEIFRLRNGFVPKVSWAGRDDTDRRAKEMKANMVAFLSSHPEVNDSFTWLGERSDVQSLYAQSDALLSVSTYEGVPVVICEAMLSGCPIVASAISDNAIVLGDGERGFLCDPLSPDDICLALERRLRATPEDLNTMTDNARVFAVQNFSIGGMVEGYDRVISSLIAR